MGRLQKPLKSKGYCFGNAGEAMPCLFKRLKIKVNVFFFFFFFLREGRIEGCRANRSGKGTYKLSLNQLLEPWTYWRKMKALSTTLINSVYVSKLLHLILKTRSLFEYQIFTISDQESVDEYNLSLP